MANIKIISECPIYDGMPVTFRAPCDCTAVSGLTVAHGGESRDFSFTDSHGNNLAGIGNLFAAGAYVKAILNTADGRAHLQNADTNAYLERQLAAKAPMYTYGTADLEAGVTPLASGMLHFVYEGGGGSSVATISFTIEERGDVTVPSGTFTAEEGMTWSEWVASGYNTIGAVVSNGIVLLGTSTSFGLADKNDTLGYVSASAAIIAGGVYKWSV